MLPALIVTNTRFEYSRMMVCACSYVASAAAAALPAAFIDLLQARPAMAMMALSGSRLALIEHDNCDSDWKTR